MAFFKSLDGGATWTTHKVSAKAGSYGYAVAFSPANDAVLYVGGSGSLFKSTDGGESWTEIGASDVTGQVQDIAVDPQDPSKVYVTTWYGFFKSTDSGATWKKTSTANGNVIEINPVSTNEIFFGGYFGVLRSTDGGETWTGLNDGLTNTRIYSLAFDSISRILYVGTYGGSVYKYEFGGSTTPTITVVSPNGGESWEGGSSHAITWTTMGTVGNVKIESSVNNGTSWTTIVASTENDGTHSWTVPNTLSTTCLVKVSETDGDPSDVSNNVFAIVSATGQTIHLVSGWNWISFNVLPSGVTFPSVFSGIATSIDQVKSQTQSVLNLNGTWTGDLADMRGIADGIMYKVKTSAACDLSVAGTNVSSTKPIALVTAWNWTAYLPKAAQGLSTAVNSIIAKLAQIKSQTQSAVNSGGTLMGDLTQMEPGKGYTLKMNEAATLTYPAGTALALWRSQSTARDQSALASITGNEYNMIVFGRVYKNGKPLNALKHYLGAFGPGGAIDCRAVADLDESGRFYATILGNQEGEAISFKVYDGHDGRIFAARENVVFRSDDLKAGFDIHIRDDQPIIAISRNRMSFGAVPGIASTQCQTATISNAGGGLFRWTALPTAGWISVSPAAGDDWADLEISVNPAGLAPGAYAAQVRVFDPEAGNSPQAVVVNLRVFEKEATEPPFGSLDSPLQNAVVSGSIPVTGWALDDLGVTKVEIFRDPVDSEAAGGLDSIYIGAAVFVEGARPDVEMIQSDFPLSDRAGWGYMLLTNTLPGGGNGIFRISAIAYDQEGDSVHLGTRTIICDNAHAKKPFGTIDAPAPGEAISGNSYLNWGWALTPPPNVISLDGSTIVVYIDGVLQPGHPVYNNFRPDIARQFPGYANSNGAVAYYPIVATALAGGIHSISWVVVDSEGNTDGIGSRYFHIKNFRKAGAETTGPGISGQELAMAAETISGTFQKSDVTYPAYVKTGTDETSSFKRIYPDENGVVNVALKELDRLEILFGEPGEVGGYRGCLRVGDEFRSLPVGSTFDAENGSFVWMPGPGFIGDYDFIFLRKSRANNNIKRIRVMIGPRS